MTTQHLAILITGLLTGCTVGTIVAAMLRAVSETPATLPVLAASYCMGYEDALAGAAPDITRPASLLADPRGDAG